ncbi:MAG: dihydrofolate reductase [Planctomycetota bacterium]|jgi:dihydrofolate reductase
MPEIIIIAALAENNAIGKDGDIPWHIKEDFRRFQKLTMGHACLMGDVTYESLPDGARPLPGRENVVLTFDAAYHPEGAIVFLSWEEAMAHLKDREKVFLCGGASIYKQGLSHADTLELTRIHESFEADTFFPDVDLAEWELVEQDDREGKNLKSGEMLTFSFLTYKRIN